MAPIVTKSQRQFWKYDIKVARDYNKTCHSGEDLQHLADEIADFQGVDGDALRNIGRPAYQNTWSPMSNRNTNTAKDRRPTIADLEKAYIQMALPARQAECLNLLTSAGSALGYSKTIMGRPRSPPKYRSLLDDHLFGNPGLRRASMPLGGVGVAPHGLNLGAFRNNPLEQINEMSNSSGQTFDGVSPFSMGDGARREPIQIVPKATKKARKFIVTPAADP